ncbi:MAG: hypothetical protein R3C32_02840 [Chloroflexota bacterium]
MLIRWVPAEHPLHRLLQQLPADGQLPGHRPGILLGRRGARWSLVAFPLLLLAVVVIVTSNHLDLEVQGGSSEIWFGLTDAARDSADTDYTILILAVAMVTAVMAALAMPLGPLLRSMPPLKAYAVDIALDRSPASPCSASCRGCPPDRSCGSASSRSSILLLVLGTRVDWAATITVVVILATLVPVALSRPNDIWSPYYGSPS